MVPWSPTAPDADAVSEVVVVSALVGVGGEVKVTVSASETVMVAVAAVTP